MLHVQFDDAALCSALNNKHRMTARTRLLRVDLTSLEHSTAETTVEDHGSRETVQLVGARGCPLRRGSLEFNDTARRVWRERAVLIAGVHNG